jgi:O-antigen/teichoic acid export membrane protein
MSGSVFAQMVLVLASPILTRLYPPEEFGLFALYGAILSILGVCSCGRYEMAIVLPKEEREAANLLGLSVLVCFSASLFFLALVPIRGAGWALLLKAPRLAPWLWLLPFHLFFTGAFLALNYWGTRQRQFKRLAGRQIMQSTVTIGAQLGSGWIFPSFGGGLILGHFLGQAAATLRLAWQTFRDDWGHVRPHLSFREQTELLKKYKDFPLFSTWASFVNTLSTMLPAMVLGYYFNPAIVGFYALGHRVLSLPLGIIGRSLSQVFYPHATEADGEGKLADVTISMFGQLLALGLVPFLLLTIAAPDGFVLIFGSAWREAGEYVRWLAVWILFVFMSSPLSSIYMIARKQRLLLAVNLLLLSSRFISLVVGGRSGSATLTIALYGVTGTLFYFMNLLIIMRLAKVSVSHVYASLYRHIFNSLIYVTPVLVFFYFSRNGVLRFLITMVFFGLFLFRKSRLFLLKPLK